MRELSVPARFTVDEGESVAAMVFEHERDDPDFVIYQRLIDGNWTDVTCAQAADQIRSAAMGLISLGVQPGDRVSIFSATCYEWAILDLAILAVGGVTVPIYETSSAEQVRWVLQNSEAVVAFAQTDAHAGMVAELSGELPALRRVLHIDGSGPKALDQLASEGAAVDKAELTARLNGLRSSDAATLIYTSGTTGRPKGCAAHPRQPAERDRGTRECLPTLLSPRVSGCWLFLPLAHVLARALTVACVADRGDASGSPATSKTCCRCWRCSNRRSWCRRAAGVREGLQHGRAERPPTGGKGPIFKAAAQTAVGLEPGSRTAAARALVLRRPSMRCSTGWCTASCAPRWAATAALRVSGGAPLGARLGHFFRGVGVQIYEGYGLTETTGRATVNPPAP